MLLSVCCITYNHENYISQTIDSFLMQKTNFDFEIVIGEDYSKDSTRIICEKYAELHTKKIKLLPSEKNWGMMPNFIRTLNACSGKYIALCEGDDYWIDPQKLQKQVDFLEKNSDFYLVVGNTTVIKKEVFEKRNWREHMYKRSIFSVSDYLDVQFFHTSSACFRRCENINFFQMEDILQGDIFLFLHLSLSNCDKIKFFEDIFSIYRIHEMGVTARPMNNDIQNSYSSLIKIYNSFNLHSGRKFNKKILIKTKFLQFYIEFKRNKSLQKATTIGKYGVYVLLFVLYKIKIRFVSYFN